MSDTKAFNQQTQIYDFSERYNLRFLVEAQKKASVSLLSDHAGTSWSCDHLQPLPRQTPKSSGFFSLQLSEEVAEYINNTSFSSSPPPAP